MKFNLTEEEIQLLIKHHTSRFFDEEEDHVAEVHNLRIEELENYLFQQKKKGKI